MCWSTNETFNQASPTKNFEKTGLKKRGGIFAVKIRGGGVIAKMTVLDFDFNACQICSKDLFIVFNWPFLPHHCDIENVIKQHVHRMINPKKHLPHQSCSFCHQRERGRGQATNILVLVAQWSSRSPGEQP